jgi:hypothetical protein
MITRRNIAANAAASAFAPALASHAAFAQAWPSGPADNGGIRLGGLRRRTVWGLFLPAKTVPGRKTSF